MKVVITDGGREAAGYKGRAGDCFCRALAIAAEMSYQEAYELIDGYGSRERKSKRRRGKSSARTGVYSATARKILADLGWTWTPTMGIGTGCRVHVAADELPPGRLILNLSRHFSTCIDGVIHDTHDPSREGTRCVYGYWSKS
jgi:hypothetical protein